MLYLGLDMATLSSGFSLFKDDKLVDYGLWKVSNKIKWRDRCLEMGNFLSTYLFNHKVDKIYCEDTIGTNNIQTTKQLSTLQGVLLGVVSACNVDIEFLPPNSWRSDLGIYTGKQEDTKREHLKLLTNQYVNKHFNLNLIYDISKPKSTKNEDDISDAIGIAYSQIKKKAIGTRKRL